MFQNEIADLKILKLHITDNFSEKKKTRKTKSLYTIIHTTEWIIRNNKYGIQITNPINKSVNKLPDYFTKLFRVCSLARYKFQSLLINSFKEKNIAHYYYFTNYV